MYFIANVHNDMPFIREKGRGLLNKNSEPHPPAPLNPPLLAFIHFFFIPRLTARRSVRGALWAPLTSGAEPEPKLNSVNYKRKITNTWMPIHSNRSVKFWPSFYSENVEDCSPNGPPRLVSAAVCEDGTKNATHLGRVRRRRSLKRRWPSRRCTWWARPVRWSSVGTGQR